MESTRMSTLAKRRTDHVRAADEAASLLQALEARLGASSVMHGHRLQERQTFDWSDARHETPLMLVLPRTTADVASTLHLCSLHRQRVVIQGGLTGLAGGANPRANEVAVSLSRMDSIAATWSS